jgi:hypothetical protein
VRPKSGGTSSQTERGLSGSLPVCCRLLSMTKPHPHEQATYSVVPFNDEFAVKVEIPDTFPTTVSKFRTKATAETWIAEHRRQVQADLESGRWFRMRRKSG